MFCQALPQSMLIRLDLPTFERPMNAYSFFVSLGHFAIVGDDRLNSEVFIIMLAVLIAYHKLPA